MDSFILGCPCGHKIKVNVKEQRKEIRCQNCKRYIKVPQSPKLMTTQTLFSKKNDQMIGKVLAKRFKIESYVADGAMGKVYRGTDLILKKAVAIKILKLDSFPSEMRERYEKRFINEARIGLELLHPNIVPVRSVHKTKQGTIFFVMDFCAGQSLRNILIQKKRLPITETFIIAKQILAALQVAHDKGIAHRDIKPGNIMIEYTNGGIKVKILDFGVAKIFSEVSGLEQQTLTKTGYIIGTTRYMAPEQILNKNVGGHTDLYAVGALMYHMICGATPFGGTRQKVLKSILRATPISLKKLCATHLKKDDVPHIVDAIISKALEKDPSRRFKDARTFIQALDYENKSNAWQYSLITQVQLHRFFGKLDKKARVVLPLFLLILAVFITYFVFISPSYEKEFLIREARHMLSAEKYSSALEFTTLAEELGNNDEIRELKKQILLEAFAQSIRKQKYKEAQYYIYVLQQDSLMFKEIAHLVEEESHVAQVEKLMESKSFSEALKSLEETSKNDDWLRQERVRWLKDKLQKKEDEK
ncbi:serine/threonine-protein kinase [Candidatus Uabimicrobium amorphum]|uniref:Serine/threonine protein kinase n=1 Tax=Uabimicrobium amorphum TaxID=2596890 RepID=A0A5S9ITL0_UABAM|nr:serine/threonine-protein kinase [Candidatus Uabimicrobium amorphum]BBM87507.1 serine/threonine protein kinase [Candidatus Uabimicrobium amorphum]